MTRSVRRFLLVMTALSAGTGLQAYEITGVGIEINDQSAEPYTIITIGSAPPINEIMAAAGDPAKMMELAGRVQAAEDNSVTIRIPAVLDYGSSGSFTNVRISSGKGISFDPGTMVSDKTEVYTGSVSIEEFSREMLSGSYSGQLYRAERINHEPWVKVFSEGQVSGWFRAGMPDLGDAREKSELPASEQARAAASAMWDGLRMAGMGWENAQQLELMSQRGRGHRGDGFDGDGDDYGDGDARGGSAVVAESCVCECPVISVLPPDHHCVRPGGDCHNAVAICEQYGLGAAPSPAAGDTEEILDRLVGPGAPPEARASLHDYLESMSPEERAGLLDIYRNSGVDPVVPDPDDLAAASPADYARPQDVVPQPATAPIPVDPKWDAETLEYKALVEQLGMPADVAAQGVEMFYNNEAPMREYLRENIKRQIEQRQ